MNFSVKTSCGVIRKYKKLLFVLKLGKKIVDFSGKSVQPGIPGLIFSGISVLLFYQVIFYYYKILTEMQSTQKSQGKKSGLELKNLSNEFTCMS